MAKSVKIHKQTSNGPCTQRTLERGPEHLLLLLNLLSEKNQNIGVMKIAKKYCTNPSQPHGYYQKVCLTFQWLMHFG